METAEDGVVGVMMLLFTEAISYNRFLSDYTHTVCGWLVVLLFSVVVRLEPLGNRVIKPNSLYKSITNVKNKFITEISDLCKLPVRGLSLLIGTSLVKLE